METAALCRISRTKIHEVFEARKLMEIELAAWRRRATPEDIKNMIASVVQTRSHKSAGLDLSFHRCLAEAAKNSVFSRVYNMIAELLFQTHKY